MSYELVAIDMDGTLLNSNNEVSKRTKGALLEAKMRGVKIVLSTGRILKSALQYAEDLGLNNPIVACNGAIIVDESQKIIYERPMDKNILGEIMDLGDKHKIYYHFYDEYSFYTNRFIKEVVEFYNTSSAIAKGLEVKVNLFNRPDEILNREDLNIFKFLFIEDDQRRLYEFRNELERLKGVNISSSWKNNLEVMDKSVSKGEGLRYLCKELNISPDKVIAIGDNENDLSMVKFAGLGVAMGNGGDKVKSSADYVTATNDKEGVAKVIEKFVLGIGDED